MKHTPAPWNIHFIDDSTSCNCKYVLSSIVPICVATIHEKVDDSLECSEYPETEQAKANAKLISAAPELLEALTNIIDAIANGYNLAGHIFLSKQLIKKATE